jgi:cytochrome c-550 PedF
VSSFTRTLGLSLVFCVSVFGVGRALAEGNDPQPVDTTGLPSLGSDWLEKNPYRGTKFQELATKIGSSGFNQNCARCHGLEAESGGLAPDLRYLDKGDEGDAWFINRVRHGYAQNGVTKMPVWQGILSQEAMWAIRTYLDSRYQGD